MSDLWHGWLILGHGLPDDQAKSLLGRLVLDPHEPRQTSFPNAPCLPNAYPVYETTTGQAVHGLTYQKPKSVLRNLFISDTEIFSSEHRRIECAESISRGLEGPARWWDELYRTHGTAINGWLTSMKVQKVYMIVATTACKDTRHSFMKKGHYNAASGKGEDEGWKVHRICYYVIQGNPKKKSLKISYPKDTPVSYPRVAYSKTSPLKYEDSAGASVLLGMDGEPKD